MPTSHASAAKRKCMVNKLLTPALNELACSASRDSGRAGDVECACSSTQPCVAKQNVLSSAQVGFRSMEPL